MRCVAKTTKYMPDCRIAQRWLRPGTCPTAASSSHWDLEVPRVPLPVAPPRRRLLPPRRHAQRVLELLATERDVRRGDVAVLLAALEVRVELAVRGLFLVTGTTDATVHVGNLIIRPCFQESLLPSGEAAVRGQQLLLRRRRREGRGLLAGRARLGGWLIRERGVGRQDLDHLRRRLHGPRTVQVLVAPFDCLAVLEAYEAVAPIRLLRWRQGNNHTFDGRA
mmetsp:Transcript_84839/g.214060  ORF Transcript_84839/g.214060 Transcript_84839/m.214060 type:complete len:222 (+) Transcript_84839:137-802(+)